MIDTYKAHDYSNSIIKLLTGEDVSFCTLRKKPFTLRNDILFYRVKIEEGQNIDLEHLSF